MGSEMCIRDSRMSYLPCIEIEPELAARATVIHHGSRDPMVAEELGHQAHSLSLIHI